MTISVGSVSVSVVPDARGIDRKLRDAVVPGATAAGEEAGKVMVQRINAQLKDIRDARVGVNVDDKLAKAELDDLARTRTSKLKVDVDKNSLSGLSGILSKIPGLGAPGAAAGAGIAVAVPAVAALAAEIVAVTSGLAAAGAGVGAFAALAIPTFSKIKSAVGDSNAQLAKQPVAIQAAVSGVKGLESEYGKLSSAFQSKALTVFNGALKIASDLLPKVVPFANTAASSFANFENRIDKAVNSKGFQSFLNQMHSIEGPALGAIENGIAKLAPAVAHLFTVFSSKDDAQAISLVFDTIAGSINLLASFVNGLRKNWDTMWSGFKTAFFAAAPVIIKGAQSIADDVLDVFKAITHGAADAFGWVPGLGGKLKTADKAVQSWRNSVDTNFGAAVAAVNGWKTAYENAPKIAKLKGDISDLTKKLSSARSQLANPALTATKRSRIQADISQLQKSIAEARNELNLLNGKTVTTFVINKKINEAVTQGPGGGSHITGFASGGVAPPGLHWIGERGPELVQFGQATRVYNAAQSQQIAGKPGSGNALVGGDLIVQTQTGASATDIIDAALYKLRVVRMAGAYS